MREKCVGAAMCGRGVWIFWDEVEVFRCGGQSVGAAMWRRVCGCCDMREEMSVSMWEDGVYILQCGLGKCGWR